MSTVRVVVRKNVWIGDSQRSTSSKAGRSSAGFSRSACHCAGLVAKA
jgi:hypothetical protein